MQRILLFLFPAVMVASCQKAIQHPLHSSHYPQLSQRLADSLPADIFRSLDFSRVCRSVYPELTLLRVAFKEKAMSESFVLLDVQPDGCINRGRIVALTRDDLQSASFNGTLQLKSLSGTLIEAAPLVNGYRVSNDTLPRTLVTPAPEYKVLPEVIVVASRTSGSSGISWSTWLNLLSFFDYSDYGMGNWYSGADPFDSGGGGGFTGGGGGGNSGGSTPSTHHPYGPPAAIDDTMWEIDFETQYGDPAIDVEQFVKCFDNIPDAGATCKVTIYSDVPVDNDPTKIMNWSTGSPGHTWIRLEKNGSGDRVSQHIGFYPRGAWKTTLTDAPVDGKFVDNGGHEFNAAYEISVSPEKFRTALVRIQQLRNLRYDIDDYNCTDWALQVWKAAADPSLWLEIPLFRMPGSLSPTGTSTPQGLYVKIKELRDGGVPGAQVPVAGWAGASNGACQ